MTTATATAMHITSFTLIAHDSTTRHALRESIAYLLNTDHTPARSLIQAVRIDRGQGVTCTVDRYIMSSHDIRLVRNMIACIHRACVMRCGNANIQCDINTVN